MHTRDDDLIEAVRAGDVDRARAALSAGASVHARSSVDNLLRTVQQHHVQLSLMADTKASILITISSIVLTIALSRAGEPHLRPALLTIAATSLVSLLLAIVAVLPMFGEPRPGSNRTRNILFFGHFSSMSEDDYMDALHAILIDDATLYEAAVRDIHSLGVYLYRKKYRFLRYAYVALLVGFIAATIVEAWVTLSF